MKSFVLNQVSNTLLIQTVNKEIGRYLLDQLLNLSCPWTGMTEAVLLIGLGNLPLGSKVGRNGTIGAAIFAENSFKTLPETW